MAAWAALPAGRPAARRVDRQRARRLRVLPSRRAAASRVGAAGDGADLDRRRVERPGRVQARARARDVGRPRRRARGCSIEPSPRRPPARVTPPRVTLSRGRLRLIADDLAGARADLADSAACHDPPRLLPRRRAGASGAWAWSSTSRGTGSSRSPTPNRAWRRAWTGPTSRRSPPCAPPAVLVLAGRGAWAEADQHLQAMLAWRGGETPRSRPSTPPPRAPISRRPRATPKGWWRRSRRSSPWRPARPSTSPGSGPGRASTPRPSSSSAGSRRRRRSSAFHEALRAASRAARSMGRPAAAGTRPARGRAAAATMPPRRRSRPPRRCWASFGMPYELALTELAHGQVPAAATQAPGRGRGARRRPRSLRRRRRAAGASNAATANSEATGLSPKRADLQGPGTAHAAGGGPSRASSSPA